MNCKGCGSEWFVEESQILPLTPLEPNPTFAPAKSARMRWAYRCAECGLGVGQRPKSRRKKTKGEPIK